MFSLTTPEGELLIDLACFTTTRYGTMNVETCIFCEDPEHPGRIVIEENGFVGRKCPNCGLIYTSPRPSPSEVINLYGHDESHISAQAHIAEEFPKRLYARHHLLLIKRYLERGSVLEIGAGAGYFLDEARAAGFDVQGIELNSTQADFIRNHLGIPCDDRPLTDASFGGKKFDLIYHCDVISHFHDPIRELRTIRDKLRPGGFMIYETGNLSDVAAKHFRAYTRFQYPDHLFFFGEHNSQKLLALTGYELVAVHRYSIMPHLLASKRLDSLRSACRDRDKRTETIEANRTKPVPGPRSQTGGFARQAWHYALYLLRYKVGAILPKKGKPQTMILVARKN